MQITQIDQTLSVSGQVAPEAVRALAEHGFRSIICNRPDGEEPGQPSWSEVEAAARDAGLEARHIPISTMEDITERKGDFAQAIEEMPGPVLAYCRTGNRSSKLYEACRA